MRVSGVAAALNLPDPTELERGGDPLVRLVAGARPDDKIRRKLATF